MNDFRYKENITDFAVSKNYVDKITLHNKEYYNALKDSLFNYFEKIHYKGEPIYKETFFSFLHGKKIGEYHNDVWQKIVQDNNKSYTTDDIVTMVKDSLCRAYGDNHVELTDEQGILLIHPHIVIQCKDNKDSIIRSFNTYKDAKRYFNKIKLRLKFI